MDTRDKIKIFKSCFKIIDFNVSIENDELINKVKMKINNEIFEFGFKHLNHSDDLIDMYINLTTGQKIDTLYFFNNCTQKLVQNPITEDVINHIDDKFFKWMMQDKINLFIQNKLALSLKEIFEIKITEEKKNDNFFILKSEIKSFEKNCKIKVAISKYSLHISYEEINKTKLIDYKKWMEMCQNIFFHKEEFNQKTRDWTLKTCQMKEVMGILIINKYKDSNKYKMLSLYNPELVEIFAVD